jgi:phospholipase/lecithinase/hemolysin
MLFLLPGLLFSRSAALAVTPFSDVIVFGDSVSDNGNDTARTLTRMYNDALDEVLDVVETRAQIRLRRLDVFSLADQVFASPQKVGFRDVITPCRGGGSDGILFWDPLHPTTAAHSLLAREALGILGLGAP